MHGPKSGIIFVNRATWIIQNPQPGRILEQHSPIIPAKLARLRSEGRNFDYPVHHVRMTLLPFWNGLTVLYSGRMANSHAEVDSDSHQANHRFFIQAFFEHGISFVLNESVSSQDTPDSTPMDCDQWLPNVSAPPLAATSLVLPRRREKLKRLDKAS